MTTDHRPISRRRLLIGVIVCVLLLLLWYPWLQGRLRSQCNHTDDDQKGVVEFKSEIKMEEVDSATKALLQLAFARQLIGADVGSISAFLKHADSIEVTHDAVYSPTGDRYTFILPCLHRDIGKFTKLRFSVTVNRNCGHVVYVSLFTRPDL